MTYNIYIIFSRLLYIHTSILNHLFLRLGIFKVHDINYYICMHVSFCKRDPRSCRKEWD